MLEIVRKTILEYDMIKPGELILAAVSGGPDSIAMLHCLSRLAGEFQFKLHVVHINHGLRPESKEEAEFVSEFAKSLGIGVSVHELGGKTLRHGSLQEWAREARRQVLLEECKVLGGAKIALGHNANDQAETVLQRLLRGGGTSGLGGIYPKREQIIRPLLFLNRRQIEKYIEFEKLEFRTDTSNYKPIYLRNKIRLQLIPVLEAEYNPRLVETLSKTALILQEDNIYLDLEAARKFEEAVSIIGNSYYMSHPVFKLPAPIIKRIIRRAFSLLTGDPRGLEFEHVNRVVVFAQTGYSGSFLELPDGVRVYKEQEGMLFSYKAISWPKIEERILDVPGETAIPELGMVIRTRIVDNPACFPLPEGAWSIVMDYEQVSLPLILRGRIPGERIFLKGSFRKLKEIFNERKIPIRLRETSPVIVQGDEVLWIPGIIRSDRSKVQTNTVRVLELVATTKC